MDDFALKIKRQYEELLAKKSDINQYFDTRIKKLREMMQPSNEFYILEGQLMAYSKVMYEYNEWEKQQKNKLEHKVKYEKR